MTDHEMLQVILEKLNLMDQRLNTMDQRLSTVEDRLSVIEENTAITRGAVNSLVEWADQVAVVSQVHFPVRKAK
jgi:hypothetical protein